MNRAILSCTVYFPITFPKGIIKSFLNFYLFIYPSIRPFIHPLCRCTADISAVRNKINTSYYVEIIKGIAGYQSGKTANLGNIRARFTQ